MNLKNRWNQLKAFVNTTSDLVVYQAKSLQAKIQRLIVKGKLVVFSYLMKRQMKQQLANIAAKKILEEKQLSLKETTERLEKKVGKLFDAENYWKRMYEGSVTFSNKLQRLEFESISGWPARTAVGAL